MGGGMIATSDPRASEVGAAVLRSGGNAVDAAVTAALALLVLEPHACGLGGDAFLLLKAPGRAPEALDGSGALPAALAAAAIEETYQPVPRAGPRTFTVPGAISMFEVALGRYGTIDLAQALGPARQLAADGFTVRASLAASARNTAAQLADDPVLAALYLPAGEPVQEGAVVRNVRLAEALDAIAAGGAGEVYEGELGRAIAQRSRQVGGYLDSSDLQAHRTETMDPISGPFQSYEVWELPAPTQGQAVLTALSILERENRFDSETVIGAITAGMLATGVDLRPARGHSAAGSDTTYLAVVDRVGLAVSLITSIFSEFGSVIGVDALGTAALGRRPQPGKPPHTTIPALVTRAGELSHVLGVVGGYMQAQGQVQVLLNLLVHGMPPQPAIEAPRFRILPGGQLALEAGHELAARWPDAIGRDPGQGGFGGCQAVACEGGYLRGGSDSRRGGLVVHVPG
jgi:gamma-glutamyltranspeptidase/glutathione hydrolase